MQFLNKNLKILGRQWHRRAYGTQLSSQEIRRLFVDYFTKEHDHQLVRSSPVVPFCDPTVAFVNAGMNQFKNIFLGTSEPRHRRVANTQKCVRVGGKHNDLSVVGTDGYHHTFFEMMGNWSFGDYFKKDACEYAWRLLTGPYNIDPNRLYVTYFAGDEKLGLAADLECREIWRNLGLPDERILPFGARDNFWEMGATGPCGPCSEIHYDHLGAGDERARAAVVNAGRADLTEIWNLVFIQYNRQANNSIIELPHKHIDTGMGLERLVAVLQGKSSNYATDLFTPIFEQIHKATKAPRYTDCYDPTAERYQLNTAYRVLADHSRMITACLADGMFPDQNHKLRRVIRKAMSLADRTFGAPDLLHTTVPATVAILGDSYPEMQRALPQVQQILRHEQEVYRALLADAATDVADILAANARLEEHDVVDAGGFVPAYRELKALQASLTVGDDVMSGDMMFKLYDTYGLREETIERLAEVECMRLDREGFAKCLQQARSRTKSTFAVTTNGDGSEEGEISLDGLPYTENELKYNYRFNFAIREYYSPKVRVEVLAVHRISSTDLLYDVVLDQSTFYPEGGGQESDRGQLMKEKNKLVSSARVQHVRMGRGDVVVHRVEVPEEGWLRVGDVVELVQDSKRRTACTLNHTATHLLNACVRRVTKSVCYQKSSSVTAQGLKLELAVLGRKIETDVVQKVQAMIESIIRTGIPVTIAQIDAHDFYAADNITRIPGEVYPDRNVRILTIEHPNHGGVVSCEPCCGTHALNTRELEHFCITHVRHTGRGAFALAAVAGRAAMAANELGDSVRRDIELLRQGPTAEVSSRILQRMRLLVGGSNAGNAAAVLGTAVTVELPYLVRVECQQILGDVAKAKRESTKDAMKDFVETEMRKLMECTASDPSRNFLVHALPETDSAEPVPLQRATKLCADRPLIVVCRTTIDGSVRARCAVPKRSVNERFGADQWLREFARVFDGQLAEPQKGQRPDEVAVMKARKVPADEYETLLAKAVQCAEEFATQYLCGAKGTAEAASVR